MNFLLNPGIAIYMALAVALVVWIGVFSFLWRLDRQAQELRRKLDATTSSERRDVPRATIEARGRQNSTATTSE
jgi:CcmD family protein